MLKETIGEFGAEQKVFSYSKLSTAELLQKLAELDAATDSENGGDLSREELIQLMEEGQKKFDLAKGHFGTSGYGKAMESLYDYDGGWSNL